MVGWLVGGREGDPEAFLFLLTGVWEPLSAVSMVAMIINNELEIMRWGSGK